MGAGMKPIQARRTAHLVSGALVAGFLAGDAQAQDGGLTGYISQYLDVTDNAALETVSAGTTLTATTTLGLDWSRVTETTTFGLGAATNLYVTQNADGTDDSQFGYPSLYVNFSDATRSRRIRFSATYDVEPAGTGNEFGFRDLDSDGIFSPGDTTFLFSDILETTAGIRLSYSTDLTAVDTLEAFARARWVEFDQPNPDLINSQEYSLGLNWSRRIAEDMSGSLRLTNRWFQNEDVIPTESVTTTLTAGVDFEAQSGMRIGADLGASRALIDDEFGHSDTISPSGSIAVDYALADGSIGADLNFDLEPTDGGSFSQTASFGVEYRKTVNDLSSLSVALEYTASSDIGEPLGTNERRITFTPSYYYSLTDDISANIGYRYERIAGGTEATSNGVFLGLTKNFALLQ
jgi:hypothetical protein